MSKQAITAAAFNPGLRPALLRDLVSDPSLMAFARAERDRLRGMHDMGQLFDRDHISRVTHEMLERMILQAEMQRSQDRGIKIE